MGAAFSAMDNGALLDSDGGGHIFSLVILSA
jgi:hypothetical protein